MRTIPSSKNKDCGRPFGRRDWLKIAGSAMLAAPALGARTSAAADDLRARAKRNVKLGIHTGPYAGLTLEAAARRIQADRFSSVLTDYCFADVRFDPLEPDWKAAEEVVACFDRHEIRIAAVYGYVNIMDPNPEQRRRGEARLAALLANWKRLGCNNVSTETGTLNPKSPWLESPENATEQAYRQCRGLLERLARMAEKAGAVVSIEPYWRNIIDSVERAGRLFREVQSPGLRLVMDPCNYFRKEDLERMDPTLDAMFKALGDKIVVAHAKDVKAAADGTDLPAAGMGVLDYPRYLRLLAGLDREVDLLLEHLVLADVSRARDYVFGQFERIGTK
jgi:sugar phosphate isomerase/epimerase